MTIIKNKLNTVSFSSSGKCKQRLVFNDYAIKINTNSFQKPIVFTFDNMDTNRDSSLTLENRDGWGENFLIKKGFNVCAFLESDIYSWYRREEFIDIMRSLSDTGIFDRFTKRITYGSSMGGYAASAFASSLNANKAILIHPISSLNEDVCPWEDRFTRAKKANWRGLYSDAVNSVKEIPTNIVFDPLYKNDNLHTQRYVRNCDNIELIKIRGLGHGMPWHLQRMKLLSDLFDGLVNESFDPCSFYKAIQKKKRFVKYYDFMLSKDNHHRTAARDNIVLLNLIKNLNQEDNLVSRHEILNLIEKYSPTSTR